MTLPRALLVAPVAALAAACLAPADAQVAYRLRTTPEIDQFLPFSDQSPYDQAFGTRPSFEVFPDAHGAAPAVRIIQRCLYPNGWNVTDFGRDVNGIPPGVDHACPEPVLRTRLRARY